MYLVLVHTYTTVRNTSDHWGSPIHPWNRVAASYIAPIRSVGTMLCVTSEPSRSDFMTALYTPPSYYYTREAGSFPQASIDSARPSL